jgi:hypothetical protein
LKKLFYKLITTIVERNVFVIFRLAVLTGFGTRGEDKADERKQNIGKGAPRV